WPRQRINCMVVGGGRGIQGLIPDRATAAAMSDEAPEPLSAEQLSRPAPPPRPDDTPALALERMHEDGTSHAVVVGPSLRLLGVVSVLDLVEWMLRTPRLARSVKRRNAIRGRPDVHNGS